MSSPATASTELQRIPTQAEFYRLLSALRPQPRAVVIAMLNGAATITEAGEIAGYAQPAQRASEALKRGNVQVALQAGLAIRADKARGVLDRVDSVVRRVARQLENSDDLTDPVALTVMLDKLLSAQRVAMELAERGGGDREEQSALGEEAYYRRLNRWNSVIERRGFAAALRYASIARKLGAGLTARR